MWGNFEAHLLEIGLTELRGQTMAAKITEPINQLYNTLFVSFFLSISPKGELGGNCAVMGFHHKMTDCLFKLKLKQ